MTRDLLIWMAGFFDGEGCVRLNRFRQRRRPRTVTFRLDVAISQKHRLPLDHFVESFGGSIRAVRHRGMLYFIWSVNGDGAATMLTALLPYLRLKREIAELGLRYYEFKKEIRLKYSTRGYPPEAHVILNGFVDQAREFNARNVPDRSAPVYEGVRAVPALRALSAPTKIAVNE